MTPYRGIFEKNLKKSLLIGFLKAHFFRGKSMLQKNMPISNEKRIFKKICQKSFFIGDPPVSLKQ